MGLFSFLKKKEPEPAPAITATIHAQTVEVKQRTRGELPLAEIGGYVSPSGGFVNYGRFCVTGMNSSTGRKNTKRYEAQTEADARAAAADDGLVEPMTVQVEPQIPPTDRQMDYALELEAMLPDGVCKEDVSAIISRITDEDEAAPDATPRSSSCPRRSGSGTFPSVSPPSYGVVVKKKRTADSVESLCV